MSGTLRSVSAALVQSVAGILIVVATLLVRRRTAGGLPSLAFWAACLVGVIAAIVGTAIRVSGVLLAVPVVVLAGVAILRGGWRLGDTGVLLTVLGIGTAWAYVIAAALDPDTGSFADQALLVLVGAGTVICSVAIAASLLRVQMRRREADTP